MTSVLNSTVPQEAAPEGDQAVKPAKAWWRFALPALLVLGLLAHIAWRLWLIRYVPTVVAHADEDRYLLSARALAGGPGGFGNDTAAFRRLGYPLLLTPIYWYMQDPFKVHHVAQIIGAVINALVFPLAYLFARRVLKTGIGLALVVSFLGALLPAVVYYSQFTLTDVLFAPLGLAWLLLIHGWLAGRTATSRLAAAMGAGAVVGYAYVTHVRGLVMLGVHTVVFLFVLWAKRDSWDKRTRYTPLIGSAVVALLVASIDWFAKASIGSRMEHGGVEPDDKLMSAVTSALGIVRTLTDAAGQFWYLSVATGGLAAVGLIVVYRAIRNHDDFPRRVVFGTLLATTVLIALSSAAALPVDMRVSNHAYFRYIAFLAPVWVMIGMSALVRAEAGARFKLIAQAAGFVGVSLFVLLTRMAPGEWFHPFDTPEVSFLTNAFDDFRPFKASLIALVLLAAWMLRQWAIPAVLLAATSLATMVVVDVKAIQPMVAKEYVTGSRLVHDIGVTPADVVESAEQVDLGSALNHQREVYWSQVRQFDAETGQPTGQATIVIAPWYPQYVDPECDAEERNDCERVHWDGQSMGWTRIYTYVNDDRRWAVWRRDR